MTRVSVFTTRPLDVHWTSTGRAQMQLTSVEAYAAKANDWTHGGEQVTSSDSRCAEGTEARPREAARSDTVPAVPKCDGTQLIQDLHGVPDQEARAEDGCTRAR